MASDRGDQDVVQDGLDRKIRSHRPPGPSPELLDRCLATLPEADPKAHRARPTRWILRPRARIAMGAVGLTAAIVATCLIFFPASNGSGNLLAEVIRAFEQAPAYHFTRTAFEPGSTEPARTKEVWTVRGVGRRMEVREGAKLVGVVVDNLRWRFQWDIERDHVIAWPSKLTDPSARTDDDAALVPRESFVKWAEKHRADVVPERDQIDGKEVEKVTLKWPGEIEMRTNTVWFDPHTRRPLKKRHRSSEGEITEVLIDYPAPETVAKELFTFQIPRSALLEVNDPQLTRQLYSEGQKHADLRNRTSAPP